jgi:hypothetical protein
VIDLERALGESENGMLWEGDLNENKRLCKQWRDLYTYEESGGMKLLGVESGLCRVRS